MSDAQLALVKGWRAELQGWIDKPPATAKEWESYQGLVKAILVAVFSFAG